MSRSRSRLFDADNPGEFRVVLNVGGQKHETYVSTLASIPDTRLAWIAERVMSEPTRALGQKREFFFDRNPVIFTHILNYYRSGKLHCPRDVCGPLFEEELIFWGIDDKRIETCCWAKYDEHRDAEEKLKGFVRLDEEQSTDSEGTEQIETITSSGETSYSSNKTSASNKQKHKQLLRAARKKIWKVLDDPHSSSVARVLGYVSLIFSMAVVATFCVLTTSYFRDQTSPQYQVLFVIEAVAVSWFTIDLLLRFICCPNRIQFLKKLQNWADLIAIIPFYLTVSTRHSKIIKNFNILYIFRLTRTFRALKFSYVMQVFTQTLRASSRELHFLIFILGIEVIVYGTIAYYCERNVANSQFTSIPSAFWYALVTMTTVGYGDMTPKTLPGKFLGCIAALSGVLMIALPVSVVASNFSLYNSYAKVKLKLPHRPKKQTVDSALKALQLHTPNASVSVQSPDSTIGRNRYASIVSTATDVTVLNHIHNRGKVTSPDDSNGHSPAIEMHETPLRRLGSRRGGHVTTIRPTPELPEGDSENEDSNVLPLLNHKSSIQESTSTF